MRQTVIVSALTAVVTVVLSVLVLNQLGAGTVSSASSTVISASSNLPSSEADDQIQGDTDCDGDVDAVDGLGVLVNVAALDALNQQEPCTDVADVIPVGEGIGPQGPQGPQGEQGPPGPQGEQGALGISGLEVIEVDSVSSNDPVHAGTALCPLGKKVIGGGALVMGTFGGIAFRTNTPFFDLSGWNAVAHAIAPQGSNWSVRVRAICANVAE